MAALGHWPECSGHGPCEFCGHDGPGISITDPLLTGGKRACYHCWLGHGGNPRTRLATLIKRGLRVTCFGPAAPMPAIEEAE